MRKKILVQSNYRPDNFGGVEYVVRNLLRLFSSMGFSLECFFGGKDAPFGGGFDGIRFVHRPILYRLKGASILSFGNSFFSLRAFRSDLIVFQEPYPFLWPSILFARLFTNTPIIVVVHANPVSRRVIMMAYDWMRSIVFSGAYCVVTSPKMLDQINIKRFVKVDVIPLCIANTEAQVAGTMALPKRYALFIGRIVRYKGIEVLLTSIEQCPSVQFVIVGDGALAGRVTSFLRERRLTNIIFLNRLVTEDEKLELIERSDFLLFPSISENEAFGLVQLEAMRAKKAVINTRLNSGVNFVAPDKVCALTVDRKDPHQLSEAIRRLWNHPALSKELGENGFERFNSLFSEVAFSDRWRTLVNEVLSNSHTR
jgi:glycosyltransferase involved in cell wall biosynthesis